MAITVADLEVRARANVGDAKKGLQGVQTQAEKSAGGAAGAFSRMGPTVGRAFTGLGAVAGAGLTAATAAAVTLADEMANVKTVVPTADIAGLTDEVQELSRASGQTTTDLTGGLYDLVSAGVSAEDAMSVLAASTNLAIGGLGTTAGAADVVTSALNAYEEGASEAGRVTDIFALAIQKGKVTADEIGASIANIAPVAASAGVSLEEVGAGYAQLTAKGVPAAQAATQMRAAISSLLTPNETLNALQEQTGKNFADIAREKGLAVALEELRQATAGNATELDKLAGVTADEFPSALAAAQDALGLTNSEVEKFSAIAGKDGAGAALAELTKEVGVGDSAFGKALGSIEGYQFALNTTGDSAGTFQTTIDEMFDATGTAAEQAAIKMESPAEAGKRLIATFTTFMQDVGGPFASSLGPIVFALNQTGGAFGGMIRMSTAAGGALGALAGRAIIPALTGLGNLTIAAGKSTAGLLMMATRGIGAAIASSIRFAATLTAQAAAAVGRFALSIVATAVPAVIGFATTIFTTAIPAVVALAVPFLPIIAIIGAVVAVVGGLFLAWQSNFLGIRDIAASVWNAITGIVGGAIDFVTGVIGGFIGFLSGLWNGLTGAASGAWDAVTGVISGAVSGITGIIGSIVGVAQGVFDTVSGIFGAIGDAAAGVGDFVGGVGDTLTGWIPSFQTGSLYTPEGPAYLHEGEAVLPPDIASQFRDFFGAGGGGGDERIPLGEAIGGSTNITVNLPGATRPMGPEDVARPLRRMAALGTW